MDYFNKKTCLKKDIHFTFMPSCKPYTDWWLRKNTIWSFVIDLLHMCLWYVRSSTYTWRNHASIKRLYQYCWFWKFDFPLLYNPQGRNSPQLFKKHIVANFLNFLTSNCIKMYWSLCFKKIYIIYYYIII